MTRVLRTTAWAMLFALILLALGIAAVTALIQQHGAWTQLLERNCTAALNKLLVINDIDSQQRMLVRAVFALEPAQPQRLQQLTYQIDARLQRLPPLQPQTALLQQQWQDYRLQCQQVFAMLAADAEPQQIAQALETRVTPICERMRQQLKSDAIADETAITAATAHQQRNFWQWTSIVAALTVVAMTLLLLYLRQLNDRYRRPLTLLARMVERINLGEIHRRLPLQDNDDFASLVLAVNRLVENMQSTSEDARRSIVLEKELTTLLIESSPQPTLVLDAGNQLIMANEPARLLFTGAAGKAALKQVRAQITADQPAIEVSRQKFELVITQPDTGQRSGGKVVYLRRGEKG